LHIYGVLFPGCMHSHELKLLAQSSRGLSLLPTGSSTAQYGLGQDIMLDTILFQMNEKTLRIPLCSFHCVIYEYVGYGHLRRDGPSKSSNRRVYAPPPVAQTGSCRKHLSS
jgi:hypothetical protein